MAESKPPAYEFDDVCVDLKPSAFLKALLAEIASKPSGSVFTLWYHSPEQVWSKDARMSLTISLPRDLETRVLEAAARQGQDAEAYVIDAVERALRKRSLDELLAPVREQFAASGMSEEELTALVKAERRAMWREKQDENRNDNPSSASRL